MDPWRTLAALKTVVRPGGCVVASIPNAQHALVVLGLIAERWKYSDSRLLDHGHLRFFTRNEIISLFDSAGFRIEVLRRNFCEHRLVGVTARVLSLYVLRDFFTLQYHVRARRLGKHE